MLVLRDEHVQSVVRCVCVHVHFGRAHKCIRHMYVCMYMCAVCTGTSSSGSSSSRARTVPPTTWHVKRNIFQLTRSDTERRQYPPTDQPTVRTIQPTTTTTTSSWFLLRCMWSCVCVCVCHRSGVSQSIIIEQFRSPDSGGPGVACVCVQLCECVCMRIQLRIQ